MRTAPPFPAASRPIALTGERWHRANGEFLAHALAALRIAVARHGLALRRERAGDPLAEHRDRIVSDEEFDRLVAPDRAAARRLGLDDPRAAELERRRREEERVAEEKEAAMTAAGTPPAIAVLGARFRLTAPERWTLLTVAAPELDPAFARLYAYANDDASLPWPTPALLERLWSGGEAAGRSVGGGSARRSVAEALLPGAPLLRWELVHAARALPGSPAALSALRVDARVASFLAGVHCADERVTHLLRRVAVPPAAPAHDELADRLASWLAGRNGGVPVLQLLGRPGSGRRAVAALVAARLGLPLHTVDLERLPPGDESWEALSRVAREAVLLPTALYLDAGAASPGTEGRSALARVRAAVETLAGPLFVGARDPLSLDRPGLSMRLPRLDSAARTELLRRALGPMEETAGLSEALAAAAEQFDLGPEAAARAATAAREEARLASVAPASEGLASGGPASAAPASVGPAELWRACRSLAGAELDDLAQRIDPIAGWEDIVLPVEVLARLRELAAQVAHRPTVYGAWGFGARLVRGHGIAALFTGPSGTGKTLAAEIMARHLNLDLYRIDLAGLISKYIGETERNLRRVFDAAETGGGILFFDEADALFGRRTEVRDSHDRYANIEIDYLLQRMEEYRGLAILATNRKTALDRAFLRRLRFLVEFPFPDTPARRSIWRRVFPPETPLEVMDFDALARLELAGGNIRNVAVNAAFLAAAAGKPVGMRHVAGAARAEYAKCEKAMTQAELTVLAVAEAAS
jgi:hypothetical protein